MLIRLLRQVIHKLILFIVFPTILAGTVFFLTKDQKKSYTTQMTISSGISSRKSTDLGEDVRLDFYTANNAIDNLITIIKSRKTAEEAGINLLAQHLSLKEPDSKLIGKESWNELMSHIADSTRKAVVVTGNQAETKKRMLAFMDSHKESVFQYLLRAHPHYGYDAILQNISVNRKQSSDMIEITYKSDDPGICFESLKAISSAFLARYKSLKGDENRSALNYFQKQLDDAHIKLQESENNLKQFITENKILNYYEQGKSLDIYKKEIEQQQQSAQEIAAGADASLRKLEQKMTAGSQRSTTIDSLTALRNQASKLRLQLSSLLLDADNNSSQITQLRQHITDLNDQISSKVGQLHNNDFSIDGISYSRMLEEWLNLYIEREKQLNAIETILTSKKYVDRRIDLFAPLGAELNKREREVKVNEGQYLSILHGLNLANLQMQNLEMSNSQEIIDDPIFPSDSKDSKRIILVVVAYLLGHLILLGILLARMLLDSNLRDSENASAITGLKTIASFPDHGKKNKRNSSMDSLYDIVLTQLASELLVIKNSGVQDGQLKICIYQSLKTDKAETVAELLADKFTSMKIPNSIWLPASESSISEGRYPQQADFAVRADWNMFGVTGNAVVPDINVCVLPTLKSSILPTHLIAGADLVLMSISSKRQWKAFDKQVLEMIQPISKGPVWMVLNEVDTDFLKDYFGSIPIKSFIGRNRKKYL
jgi:uncharacterized protein involved in exopolysaccharide biosynthesis